MIMDSRREAFTAIKPSRGRVALGPGRTVARSTLLILFAATASFATCVGDCDNSKTVSAQELVEGVNITLGTASPGACPGFDRDGNERVTVDELAAAVDNGLNGCPAEPTPTPTTSVSPSPLATSPAGCDKVTAIVSLAYDPNEIPQLAGITIDVNYPASVSLPGSGSDSSVVDRVTDLSGAFGFFQVDDRDSGSDGVDDQLRTAYATTDTIAPGEFEQIEFDCQPGTGAPTAADFSCVVAAASDGLGFPAEGVACSVQLNGEPSPTPTQISQAPTATTAETATRTNTPTPSPTATATTVAAPCGNNVVEPGETCDDGNTLNGDACPSDCRIQVCAPAGTMQTVAVSFSPPEGVNVGSLTVLLQYPDGTVQIPGSGGDASVGARITNKPSGFLVDGFDLDYALRIAVAGSRALSVGQIFRVSFDRCNGSQAPVVTDFACSVEEAFDTSFSSVSGVTCSVAFP